jgi:hypothetical protein
MTNRSRALTAASLMLLLSACQQKMAHQPYYRTQEPSEFYADGRSARPLEQGTISYLQLPDDNPLMTGLTPEGRKAKTKKVGDSPEPALPGAADGVKNFVDEFPFKLDEDDIRRGMERYTIFCTPCHGARGDGKGKIVERGYLQPPSYHTDPARSFERFRITGAEGKPLLLRDAPVGYYFEVMSRGFGGMPDHSAQIPPADRWRIAAYIRVLQLSQAANIKDLPADQQRAAREALGSKQQ